MNKEDIKQWVVQKARVTNPYRKEEWYASVTLGGMDINGKGYSIEAAYNDLASFIQQSKYYSEELEKIKK